VQISGRGRSETDARRRHGSVEKLLIVLDRSAYAA